MKRRIVLLSLVASSSLLAAAWRPAAAQEVIGLPLGARPGVAQVEDLDGDSVDLGRYIGSGKPALFEFWATWCPNCRALAPQLAAVSQRYGSRMEIVVIAVAVNQSVRRVGRYVEEHGAPGPVYWDGDGQAVRAFNAPATSYVVILDGEGKVAYTGLGPEQDLDAAVAGVLGERG